MNNKGAKWSTRRLPGESKKDRELRSQREYSARMRAAIFEILGKRCQVCGFSDVRALQIDHVYNNGYEERKQFGTNTKAYYRYIINKLSSGDCVEYQILCANCNWIKKAETACQ